MCLVVEQAGSAQSIKPILSTNSLALAWLSLVYGIQYGHKIMSQMTFN